MPERLKFCCDARFCFAASLVFLFLHFCDWQPGQVIWLWGNVMRVMWLWTDCCEACLNFLFSSYAWVDWVWTEIIVETDFSGFKIVVGVDAFFALFLLFLHYWDWCLVDEWGVQCNVSAFNLREPIAAESFRNKEQKELHFLFRFLFHSCTSSLST